MKKTLLILGLSISLFCVSTASIAGSIPSKSIEFIKNNFPGAKNIQWTQEAANVYAAFFVYDNKETTVLLNEAGKLIRVEKEIHRHELPINLEYVYTDKAHV